MSNSAQGSTWLRSLRQRLGLRSRRVPAEAGTDAGWRVRLRSSVTERTVCPGNPIRRPGRGPRTRPRSSHCPGVRSPALVPRRREPRTP